MAMLLVVAAAIAWSIFDIKRKLLAAHIQPLILAAALAGAVTPVYGLLYLVNHTAFPVADYWLPALASLIVSSLAAVGFIQAVKVGRIALLIPVLSISPIVAALASYLFFDDSLSLLQWLAMVTIVVAIFFLNGGLSFSAGPGTVLMVLVAFGWGSGLVFDKLALQYTTPLFHGFIQSLGMFVFLSVVFVLAQRRLPRCDEVSGLRLQYRSFIFAVMAFLLAVICQLYALQFLHPGLVETIKRAVGMLGAIIWGRWLFEERLRLWQLALVLLIIMGVAQLLLIPS